MFSLVNGNSPDANRLMNSSSEPGAAPAEAAPAEAAPEEAPAEEAKGEDKEEEKSEWYLEILWIISLLEEFDSYGRDSGRNRIPAVFL